MDLHQLFVTLTELILVQKGSEGKSLNTDPFSATHNCVHHDPAPCPKSPALLICSLYKGISHTSDHSGHSKPLTALLYFMT